MLEEARLVSNEEGQAGLMFSKILIANRGEIAVRVIKTARRMGIKTVVVYSEADADSLAVEMADETVFIGPPPANQSYLVADKIIDACKQTGAQAVHPGFGFLSERADFAQRCADEGIVFIGPNPGAITAMGDKIESKKFAQNAGVSCVPGHIGEIEAWPFYGIDYPVKPIVYDFPRPKDFIKHMDKYGIERSLCMSNYGIPKPEQPFSLNPIVMEAATSSDRVRGLLWVSFLPRDREHTLEALRHCGEAGIIGLKTTFLLGGNPNPAEWDEETKELADMCFDACEKHDYVFHFHTSAGPLPMNGRTSNTLRKPHHASRTTAMEMTAESTPRPMRTAMSTLVTLPSGPTA